MRPRCQTAAFVGINLLLHDHLLQALSSASETTMTDRPAPSGSVIQITGPLSAVDCLTQYSLEADRSACPPCNSASLSTIMSHTDVAVKMLHSSKSASCLPEAVSIA